MPVQPPTILTEDEALGIVEPILRARMARYGLHRVEVRSEIDYAGDPSLVVEAFFERGREPFDVPEAVAAHDEASRALFEAGDRRFSYFEDRVPDDVEIAPFELPA